MCGQYPFDRMKRMSGPRTDDQLYRELLVDWLRLNRRDILSFGAGAFAYLVGIFDRAYADAEFPIEATPYDSESSKSRIVEPPQNGDITAPKTREKTEETDEQENNDTGVQLGVAFRAPTTGLQNMSAAQLRATNTPDKAPNYLSSAPGSFFSDAPSRMFLTGGETALATALRNTAVSGAQKPATDRPDKFTAYEATHTSSKVPGFVSSVEWREAGSALLEFGVEQAKGQLKDVAVEKIVVMLLGEIAKRPLGLISFVHDVFEVTELNRGQRDELTYYDRLSPSEKREFFHEVFNHRAIFPNEMPPSGPVLQNAY